MIVFLVLVGIFIILTFIFPTKKQPPKKTLTKEELEIQRGAEKAEEEYYRRQSGKWDPEDDYDPDDYDPCTDD